MSFGRSVRRHRHKYDNTIMLPNQPRIWIPNADQGDKAYNGQFCNLCAQHYPRMECFFPQADGQRAAGIQCPVCDHVVKRLRMFEHSDKLTIDVVLNCHGDEETHVLDMGSVEHSDNASQPSDTGEHFRRLMHRLKVFQRNEQGEKTVA
jgi:hypothetical protein